MKHVGLVVCGGLLWSGCVFGDKTEPKNNSSTANAVTNAVTNGATNGSTHAGTNNNVQDAGTPDSGMADMGGEDVGMDVGLPPEVYAPLNATEVRCTAATTPWFKPGAGVMTPINEDSVVATAGPPSEFSFAPFGVTALGEMSVAHATPMNTAIHVYLAAAEIPTPATGEIIPLFAVETSIELGVEAEVYAVAISPSVALFRGDMVGDPPATFAKMSVASSEGIIDCVATLGLNDATEMTCGRSAYNDELEGNGIDSVARFDPAPVFSSDAGMYTYDLLSSPLLVLASGPTTDGGETFGVVRANVDGTVDYVDVSGAMPTTLDSPQIFAERVLFGVESSSFGIPLISALTPSADGLTPVVLKSADPFANAYEVVDRGTWSLSERVTPLRGQFTFVDAYEAEMMQFLRAGPSAGYEFVPGTLRLGYVALDKDGGALVFARPDGFLGADFLEFDLPNAQEVTALKNIPAEPNATGRPAIAVIHGQNRDQLALFDWGIQIDAKWVSNVLDDQTTNAQKVSPSWFFADVGTIPMLAQRTGEGWVTAVVRVPNFKDLSAGCR